MKVVITDGGRAAAGYKGRTSDCVARALAIAVPMPYEAAYELVGAFAKQERITKRRKTRSSARGGVRNNTMRRIMEHLGWQWVPTMQIGSGCKVHLSVGELPSGRLIVSVSKHVVAVIDGVMYDNHDPCRGGSRCVYGYWRKP